MHYLINDLKTKTVSLKSSADAKDNMQQWKGATVVPTGDQYQIFIGKATMASFSKSQTEYAEVKEEVKQTPPPPPVVEIPKKEEPKVETPPSLTEPPKEEGKQEEKKVDEKVDEKSPAEKQKASSKPTKNQK
jgi:hypothetical protein